MAIKQILFNTEMVRATLDGRKSCARRLVKFFSGENPWWTGYIKDGLMLYNGKNEPCIRKAPYQPGNGKNFGPQPSRNPTLTATDGMRIRGFGLSNLRGARNQNPYESSDNT